MTTKRSALSCSAASPSGADSVRRICEESGRAEGTPEDIAATKESYTGQYLKPIMARKPAPSGRLREAESEGAGKKPRKQAAE